MSDKKEQDRKEKREKWVKRGFYSLWFFLSLGCVVVGSFSYFSFRGAEEAEEVKRLKNSIIQRDSIHKHTVDSLIAVLNDSASKLKSHDSAASKKNESLETMLQNVKTEVNNNRKILPCSNNQCPYSLEIDNLKNKLKDILR